MRRLLASLILFVANMAAAASPVEHDDFTHLVQINKASLVMLIDTGLVAPALAAEIAAGISNIAKEETLDGSERSANYLVFEKRLIELVGDEASKLHTGRSRQDIGSTYRRMALRESLLDVYESLLEARQALLELAAAHPGTVIPAYTHGVQAQPISLGHYLLAFASAFERDAQRLGEAYTRLNMSTLGAAALGTSGFEVDRISLAELLGFDGVVENSYDANLVSSVDSKIEFANAMATSAIMVGQFAENLHTQYHNPVPWFLLAERLTDVSSIMPQKRNPRPIDKLRTLATAVIGNAHIVSLNAHNTNSGMNDYRPGAQTQIVASKATEMYTAYVNVISNLVINADRAMQEVNIDYSTMTEVADTLLRNAQVPFRVAHHYASELTRYGRARGMRPMDFTDEELLSIYEDAIGSPLPVEVSLIRAAMDPAAMVENRRGLGGPQAAEVARMLTARLGTLKSDSQWLYGKRQHIAQAGLALEQRFQKLK